MTSISDPRQDMGASSPDSEDRAGRATPQAPSGLDHSATIPCAFTPGPWLIHAERRWVVPAQDAFKAPLEALPICQLRDQDERLTEDETLANGFLIAASPDLFESCQAALQWFEDNGCAGGIAAHIRGSLRKATGDAA